MVLEMLMMVTTAIKMILITKKTKNGSAMRTINVSLEHTYKCLNMYLNYTHCIYLCLPTYTVPFYYTEPRYYST